MGRILSLAQSAGLSRGILEFVNVIKQASYVGFGQPRFVNYFGVGRGFASGDSSREPDGSMFIVHVLSFVFAWPLG